MEKMQKLENDKSPISIPVASDAKFLRLLNRSPEFHLYLYSFEGAKKDIINANTIGEVEARIREGKDVDTYQVMACTTIVLQKGYRIFVHQNPNDYPIEITFGTNRFFGNRELRVGHNLPRMIACYFDA